jgi:glycosyltransferase involved in cell wall biosynthesis
VKILFLCHEFPIASYAGTLRVLHSLETLSGKYGHDITLLAFKIRGKNYPDLSRCCRAETVELKRWPGLSSPGAALSNIIGGRNMAYSSKMAAKFCAIMTNNRFDLLVIDHPVMLAYTGGLNIPKVLLEAFELAEIARMDYENEKNLFVKLIRLVYYRQMRGYADTYAAINKIIAVSDKQKEVVLSHRTDLDIEVIPLGVDTGYFQPAPSESAAPGLVITGTMSVPANKKAVLSFYREVYPAVKAKVPDIKLNIVGSNPDKEISALAQDKSVAVTGYVDDLRPYLADAWVIAAPLQEGFGTKIRLLQAMAMGKPVIATALAGQGLDATPGENIIIADKPQDIAEKIVELISDPALRKRIGNNARKLMETNHNREKLSERLNGVLEKTAAHNVPEREQKS